MSESTKAVFLSYAREDADAAKRIAEALRASGLEVWFDQNELRGGEAWDAKIRKQIDACALFIPLISVHTQERNKGYFRLEWKLAVDETHLLAAGVPFIAPVVVDDTKESGALVPPEFMKVQWTRLPGALPTPEFVAQVKRLMLAPMCWRTMLRSHCSASALLLMESPLSLWKTEDLPLPGENPGRAVDDVTDARRVAASRRQRADFQQGSNCRQAIESAALPQQRLSLTNAKGLPPKEKASCRDALRRRC